MNRLMDRRILIKHKFHLITDDSGMVLAKKGRYGIMLREDKLPIVNSLNATTTYMEFVTHGQKCENILDAITKVNKLNKS